MSTACTVAQTPKDKPLPEMHDLLLHADEVNSSSASMLDRFEYVQVDATSTHVNHDETPPKVTAYIGYSIQGVPVIRRVLTNGGPLTTDEQRVTDDDVSGRIREQLAERKKSHKAEGSSDSFLTYEKMGIFSDLHRVVLQGRPSIVAKYAGDAHRKASGLNEKIAGRSHGTMIFDEEDGAPVSTDLTLDSDVSYLVVAKMRKGFRAKVTLLHVAKHVWLPGTNEYSGSGGLLLSSMPGWQTRRYSSYVETGTHPTDPYSNLPLPRIPERFRIGINSLIQSMQEEQGEADAIDFEAERRP